MKLFEAEDIKLIDKYCEDNLGIPSLLLMENAAISILKHLDLHINNTFTIICGVGNNGGDGLAVARHLLARGKTINVFIIGDLTKASSDFSYNKNIIEKLNVDVEYLLENDDLLKFTECLKSCDVVIDAILGIGLKRMVTGVFKDAINLINNMNKMVVAVDIPSGIDSNTGEVKGASTYCNKTVTFGCYKKGMIENMIYPRIGKVIQENIGIPEFVFDIFHKGLFLSTEDFIQGIIPKRSYDGHKGKFGRVSVIAGQKGYTGAAYITVESAIGAGSGLVTLITSKYVQDVLSTKIVEAMTYNYSENEQDFERIIGKSDCIAIGPGLGVNNDTLYLLKKALESESRNIVIDADALNVLSDNMDLLSDVKGKSIVITPHPGEMAKLIGKNIQFINDNRIEVSKALAKKYNIVVLLKGHHTIITDGERVFINSTGNSAMSSGGMGDCLTGIIASIIGQGIDSFRATVFSAYVHGLIADELHDEFYTIKASQIIENLSRYIKRFEEK
ncbi:MAG: NAD(P)H-hydrate dehydratase [Sarcina sp.]